MSKASFGWKADRIRAVRIRFCYARSLFPRERIHPRRRNQPGYPLGIFAAPGIYSRFLESAPNSCAPTERAAALANLVEREIEWLRRGAKARTSKSKARIDNAFELQGKLADGQRAQPSGVQVDFTATGRLPKAHRVEGVAKSMGGRLLFRGLKFALGTWRTLGYIRKPRHGKVDPPAHTRWRDSEPDHGSVRPAEGTAHRIGFDRTATVSISTSLCAALWLRTATP